MWNIIEIKLINIFLLALLALAVSSNENIQVETPNFRSSEVKESLYVVPKWLQDYTKWHKQQLQRLDDPSTKFLILTCHRDYACGGVSDRLRPLPYFLHAAYSTQRVFFIKWQKFNLEDFLVPPTFGIDWRLPKGMEITERPLHASSCKNKGTQLCNIFERVVTTSLQTIFVHSREDLYGDYKDEYFVTKYRANGTFREIMNILFEPVKPLAQLIRDTSSDLGLVPNQYLSAHFRSRYPRPRDTRNLGNSMSDDLKNKVLHNSINCVIHESGGNCNIPVYFTSDDANHVDYMIHESPFITNKNSPVKIVGLLNITRLHSDELAITTWEDTDPKHLYPVYVDLWIMRNSRCVSYGQGGFGLFGARLAGENCMMQHQIGWDYASCPSAF